VLAALALWCGGAPASDAGFEAPGALLDELDRVQSLRWWAARAGLAEVVAECAAREDSLVLRLGEVCSGAPTLSVDVAAGAAAELLRRGRSAAALAALEACREEGSEDAEFLRALCLEREGRCGEAAERYGSYASRGGLLGDYALFFASNCLARRGGSAAALDPLRRIVSKWKHSPLWAEAALGLCEHCLELKRYDECQELAREVAARAPSSTSRVTAKYMAARALEGAGRPMEAAATYWEVVRDHPSHPKAGRAYRTFSRIRTSTGPPLTREERFIGATALLNTGNVGEAYRLFGELAAGGGAYRREARVEMAAINYRRRRYSKAARQYLELAERGGMDRAEAMLRAGKALIRAGKYERAFEILEDVAQGSGAAAVRAEAVWEAARERESLDRVQEAAEDYRRLAELFPSSSFARAARWRRGFCLYLLGDWEGALAAFDEASETARAPHREAQAYYWKAKALARLGKLSEAHASLRTAAAFGPGCYYGARALLALGSGERPWETAGADSRDPFAELVRGAQSGDALDSPGADSARGYPGRGVLPGPLEPALDPAGWHYSRGIRLLLWGRPERAVGELREAVRAGYRKEAIVDVLFFYGQYRQAMRLGGDSPPDDVSSAGENGCYYKFPVAFAEHVWRRCRDAELDPYLVLALMRQESRFDPKAVSWAGAYGLMQLMPSTARRAAKGLGVRWRGTRDLLRPASNIRLGTAELESLLEELGGVPEALAGYNAGRSRALAWAEGIEDADAYIERIGYRQTRDYVKLVLRDYLLYRRLYGPSVP